MSELKSLSQEAIPAALEKAERYRLLNEPGEAESICLDILKTDSENQQAIITLLLALTDRFEKGYAVSDMQTKELLSRMKSEYDRAYYTGIVAERRAKVKLRQNTPDCRFQAYDLFREAMSWFEKAEAIRPPGHDDALLRWNTCARIIERNNLVPREEEERIEFPLELWRDALRCVLFENRTTASYAKASARHAEVVPPCCSRFAACTL